MNPAAGSDSALVLPGTHLFPWDEVRRFSSLPVFMAEDVGLCTYVRHHKLKLVLFLSAMRSYADGLRERGFDVTYCALDANGPAPGRESAGRGAGGPASDRGYEQKLRRFVRKRGIRRIVMYEIEDRFFERRMVAFAQRERLDLEFCPSPMFLTPRPAFADWLDGAGAGPLMASFYRWQRRRLDVLMEDDAPVGERWSFDADNRQKLPADIVLPEVTPSRPTDHDSAVAALVERRFGDHPGSTERVWFPTTRRSALRWLRDFLEQRLPLFGDYEDALSRRGDFLFHSVLSPALNLGLITPREVLDRTLEHAGRHDIPLNSLEGFVRQLIGWREFIRGIDRHFGEEQESRNFWGHERRLGPSWWTGETGIPPLDDVIRKALRLGWTHHIERLMVVGNLMLLCEIEPRESYRWFMEMHIDSSDWVMGPNVFGMALHSDGGIFATKPYICASNYLLKMSDYSRGPWCDVVDGLYWRFIDRHADVLRSNPRLSVMVRGLGRLGADRRRRIFASAEHFLDEHTGAH